MNADRETPTAGNCSSVLPPPLRVRASRSLIRDYPLLHLSASRGTFHLSRRGFCSPSASGAPVPARHSRLQRPHARGFCAPTTERFLHRRGARCPPASSRWGVARSTEPSRLERRPVRMSIPRGSGRALGAPGPAMVERNSKRRVVRSISFSRAYPASL
jgi:hypothetical protein